MPALKALRRFCRLSAEKIERLVLTLFAQEVPRRKKRLLLYALRKYSSLRPSEIARRHDRSPGAVTLAIKHLDREAEKNPVLAQGLKDLQEAGLC